MRGATRKGVTMAINHSPEPEWAWLFEEFGKVYPQPYGGAIAISMNNGGGARVSCVEFQELGASEFFAHVVMPNGHGIVFQAWDAQTIAAKLRRAIG